MATLVKSNLFTIYAISQPNFQPEDKGPDGLFLGLDLDQGVYIELRSIKSKIDNPYYLVASVNFRNGGKASKKKQIEEYYLLTLLQKRPDKHYPNCTLLKGRKL